MEPSPAQVIDLGAFRERSRNGARPASHADEAHVGPDRADAEAIVDSLLEATPNIDRVPAQLLSDARRFCIEQLTAALPRYVDDHAATVQLVKRVRTALRRSVPDQFLLEALADAGGVWPTPGASHWPAAWLHHLDPARPRYLATADAGHVQCLVEYLSRRLAQVQLPVGGQQSRRAHLLDRVGWLLQQPEVAGAFGVVGHSSTGHACRDVAFPGEGPGSGYPRLDLLVSLRVPATGARYDIVVVAADREGSDEVTALNYAERLGAIALRLVPSSAPASLFATDLVIPDWVGQHSTP